MSGREQGHPARPPEDWAATVTGWLYRNGTLLHRVLNESWPQVHVAQRLPDVVQAQQVNVVVRLMLESDGKRW